MLLNGLRVSIVRQLLEYIPAHVGVVCHEAALLRNATKGAPGI